MNLEDLPVNNPFQPDNAMVDSWYSLQVGIYIRYFMFSSLARYYNTRKKSIVLELIESLAAAFWVRGG